MHLDPEARKKIDIMSRLFPQILAHTTRLIAGRRGIDITDLP